MKITIRNNVWETNSSSVHSISISKKGLRKCKLKPSKDGYIHIPMAYFGRDLEYYDTQHEKLCYLLVCCCYIAGCVYDEGEERLYEDYHFLQVEKAVLHYLEKEGRYDVLGIKVDHIKDAELDHQSIPEFGEFPIPVNIWDEESIQNFIFNSYISLKTDCD